jgi:hypothetical protein
LPPLGILHLVEQLTSQTSESKSAKEPHGESFGPPPCSVRCPARWAASLKRQEEKKQG